MARLPPADWEISPAVVRALLEEQHPDLAGLPMEEAGVGWDNCMYRLGDEWSVRVPRRTSARRLIEHEQRWLPILGPRLPLPVPVPVRVGQRGCGVDASWVIARWIPGRDAETCPPHDAVETARQLGVFLAAMHQPAPADAPDNPDRGALADRSVTFWERAAYLPDVDRRRAEHAWEECLRVPGWSGPSVWVHADLHSGNVLVDDGRLSGVIDFGDICAGDPAVDLPIAWMLLPADARAVFRGAACNAVRPVDDDTWRRGLGWALFFGVIFFTTAEDKPERETTGLATIHAVLTEMGV